MLARVQRQLEPAVVAANFYTATDERIRKQDVPEREQVWRARLGDHAAPSTADARRMEAQWIFQMALSKQAASAYEEAASEAVLEAPQQDASLAGRWSKLNPLGHRARFLRGLLVCGREEEIKRAVDLWENEREEAFRNQIDFDMPQPQAVTEEQDDQAVVQAIENYLQLLHVQHLEPAFIAQYRREQVAPLLRGRADEWMHPPSDNGPLPRAKVARWELLWAVDEWDKRYLVLEQVRACHGCWVPMGVPCDV